jgi:hypothetical protein
MARRNIIEIILQAVDKATPTLDRVANAYEEQQKRYENLSASLERVGQSMMVTGAATTAGLAAIATKGFGIYEERLTAADNLIRQYGESQANMWQRWATELEKKTAVSRDAFLEEAQAVFALNKAYGLSIDQTQMLTERSLDLAKAKRLDLREANERVIAAIRGEAEAAEYLGLTLNETYMKNVALNGAYRDRWEKMTEMEKAQARYLEFLNQSSYAEGIAEEKAKKNTSAMDRLAISLSNAAAIYWEAVAPAVLTVTEKIEDLTEWFNSLDQKTQHTIATTATFGSIALVAGGGLAFIIGKMIPVVATIGQMTRGLSLATLGYKLYALQTRLATAAQSALNFVMGLNPFVRVAMIVMTLVGAIVTLYKTNDTARRVILTVWRAISSGVGKYIDFMLEKLQWLYGWIPRLGDKIAEFRGKVQSGFAEYEKKLTANINSIGVKHSETTTAMVDDIKGLQQEKLSMMKGSMAADQAMVKSNATLGESHGEVASSARGAARAHLEAKDAVEEYKKAQIATVEFQMQQLDKSYQLRKAQLDEEKDKQQLLTLELEHYQQKQKLVAEQLNILQGKFDLSKKVKGEDAEATRQLRLAIMDLQLEQLNLTKSVKETTEEIRKQHESKLVFEGDSVFKRNKNGDLVQVGERGIDYEGRRRRNQERRDRGEWVPDDHLDTHVGGFKDLPRYADGTNNHPGGYAIVGEEGPEIVDLPGGSKVYPNEKLDQVLSPPGTPPINLYFNFGSSIFTGSKNEFKRFIQNEVVPVVDQAISRRVLHSRKV